MRLMLALPLLMLAACDVRNDEANDQVELDFNQEQVEGAAEEVGNAAEQAVSDVGNAAERGADVIANEVGDIDVDIDVNNNKSN